ncbi:hypothetical protein AAE478_000386 [Parahypoxylon ruwenzoriense]
MNNFGVIELASTKTTNAPGWAYVPDTGSSLGTGAAAAAAASSLQPGNRKRAARNQAGANLNLNTLYADADARQEAKLRREIEVLDRDNYHRDVSIPIPTSSKSNSGKGTKKHTPNVRKILQSQKTFANHLDDFEAMLAHAESNPQSASATTTAAGTPTASSSGPRRAAAAAAAAEKHHHHHHQQQKKKKSQPPSRSASISKATPVKQEEGDVEMSDAPAPDDAERPPNANPASQPHSAILTPYSRPGGQPPPSHPLDDDPLLASRVPPLPTDAELRALLSAPPLSYAEARGRWRTGGPADDDGGDGRRRYPPRVFCEVCGYWGRVRCMKCGARVCALDCLETHREECVTRYGL